MRNYLLLLIVYCCFSKTEAQILKGVDKDTRIDSMIQFHVSWPEPNFKPRLKENWKWHAPGKPLERIQYTIDSRDSSWNPVKRFRWRYHPIFDDEMAMKSWRWLDREQSWKLISRDSSIYNVSGQVVQTFQQVYAEDKKEWKTESEVLFSYNLDGKLEQTVFYPADTTQIFWPSTLVAEYVYRDNGELGRLTYFISNPDSSTKAPIVNVTFAYTADGKILREEQFFGESEEYKQTAFSSVYDSQGRLVKLIKDRSSLSGTQWNTDERIVYEFDAPGRLKLEAKDIWNSQSQSWGRVYFWEIYGESFKEEIPNYTSSLFEICPLPNPASTDAPFICAKLSANELYQLRVLDLQGRLIFEKEFAGDERVFWEKGLNAGLYLLGIGPKDKALHYQKFLLRY